MSTKIAPIPVQLRQEGRLRAIVTHSKHVVVQGNTVTTLVDLAAPDRTLRVGEGAAHHKEITAGNGAFLQVSLSNKDFEAALDDVDPTISTVLPVAGAPGASLAIRPHRPQQLRFQVIDPIRESSPGRGPGTLLFEAFAPGCLADRCVISVAGSYHAQANAYFFAAYFEGDVVAAWMGQDNHCHLLSVVDVSTAALDAVRAIQAGRAPAAGAAPAASSAVEPHASTVQPAVSAPAAAVSSSVAMSTAAAATASVPNQVFIAPFVPKGHLINLEMTGASLFIVDGKSTDLATIRFADFAPVTPSSPEWRERLTAAQNRETAVAELFRVFGNAHALTMTSVHKKAISKLAICPDGSMVTVATDHPKVLHSYSFSAQGEAAHALIKIESIGHQRRWSNLVGGNNCLFALGNPRPEAAVAPKGLVAAIDEATDKNGAVTLHVFSADVQDDTMVGGNFLASIALDLGGSSTVDSLVVVPRPDAEADSWVIAASNKLVIAVAVTKTAGRVTLAVDRIWKLLVPGDVN